MELDSLFLSKLHKACEIRGGQAKKKEKRKRNSGHEKRQVFQLARKDLHTITDVQKNVKESNDKIHLKPR